MSQAEKRLRVGFDGRWLNDSGVGTYVAELLRAMALAEEVGLVVYEDPANRVPGLEACEFDRVAVRAGKYSVAGQIALARRCRQDRLAVFHSPFYVTPLMAGCPVVVTVHDLIPFLFPAYSRAKSTLVKAGYQIATHKAAQIITVSQNTAEDVHRILKVDHERITVVHNAASDVFHPRREASELAVLKQKHGVKWPYVMAASARNWRTKNLEGALKALEIARNRGAQFQTVIYGPKDGIEAAGGVERWSSLDPQMTGQIDAQELATLFRHAAVFIMPSLYEGFGLPVVEAMACGCAVVTSNRGSLAEIAGNGAQLFDPMDVAGMAEAVARLLIDEEELKKWKAAALKRAADFSWKKAAEETISVYHRAYREGTAGE